MANLTEEGFLIAFQIEGNLSNDELIHLSAKLPDGKALWSKNNVIMVHSFHGDISEIKEAISFFVKKVKWLETNIKWVKK
jgi:hypothetical protein